MREPLAPQRSLTGVCAFVGMCALPLFFKTEFYPFTVKYRLRQFKRKVRAVCSEMAGQVNSEKTVRGNGTGGDRRRESGKGLQEGSQRSGV